MLLAASLLILIPALLVDAHATQGQGATVRLEVPSKEPQVGAGSFDVSVLVDDVTNLGAFEFQLTYDGNVVETEDAKEGPFLGSSGRRVQCLPPEMASGSLVFRCVTLGATPDGPTGSGVLAVVTFRPAGAGTSSLHFGRVVLTDPPGTPFAAGTEDASLIVEESGGGFAWILWGSVAGGVAAVLVLSGAAVWWFRRRVSRT